MKNIWPGLKIWTPVWFVFVEEADDFSNPFWFIELLESFEILKEMVFELDIWLSLGAFSVW